MKKSSISWVLLALLGIVPLGAGLLSTYQNLQSGESAPVAYMAPEGVGSIQSTGEPVEQQQEQALPIAETVAVVDAVRNNGDTTALIGALNTAVMGWFTWFYRRREKVEATLKKLQLDMGDLGLMPFRELAVMLVISFISPLTFKRLLLRTNRLYSIYGFTHTSILPRGNGRPMQHIDRTARTTEWVLDDFEDEYPAGHWKLKERSLTGLVRAWADVRAKEVGFMQDDENSVKVNYADWLEQEDWRTDASYTNRPSAVASELIPGEIAIMLFFDQEEGESVYTLIAENAEMPETLEQWEDFIMAFRGENASLIKDKVISTIVAIHKPVA